MTQTAIRKKVLNLEAELETIKKALKSAPDLGADERVWQKIKPSVKQIRAKLYKERYGKA